MGNISTNSLVLLHPIREAGIIAKAQLTNIWIGFPKHPLIHSSCVSHLKRDNWPQPAASKTCFLLLYRKTIHKEFNRTGLASKSNTPVLLCDLFIFSTFVILINAAVSIVGNHLTIHWFILLDVGIEQLLLLILHIYYMLLQGYFLMISMTLFCL